ncbi:hypothetical protein [Sabulibacter ruber]|uniref:hypothetical protein n=1 Tax=Sabulibacter ruber TaxID=2811901 RepID=UPI001A977A74|nr:hypothetical protein [Sabulibacter ruber]
MNILEIATKQDLEQLQQALTQIFSKVVVAPAQHHPPWGAPSHLGEQEMPQLMGDQRYPVTHI